MPMLLFDERAAGGLPRERCYGCFRPHVDCFCAAIPAIDNRTEVLIVQHFRERFHPFNTARIVRRALRNSSLLVDHTRNLAALLRLRPLHPRAGLLYPEGEAELLADLPAGRRPPQLVILDGTWHHAKTLLRDIAPLGRLPRYRLAPRSPGTYRIRREPTATSLSTVEATVAALRVLEPETRGLDQLLAAFNSMVERQLAHPKADYGQRRHERRQPRFNNTPRALTGPLEHVVVAYGETTPRERHVERAPRWPVYWVAERLVTGERFACPIQSAAPPSDALLQHFELTRQDFSRAMPLAEARAAWAAFLRPCDWLAVYNQSVAELLERLGGTARYLVLKSILLHAHRPHGTLEELVESEGLLSAPARHPGRAGRRLANVKALVHHLHALGRATERGK